MSHTVKIKVEYKDPGGLRAAVLALGGQWLGQGTHKLFAGPVTGLGFTLPGWRFPLALTGTELAYDDYHGSWGNVQDLDRLRSAYAIGCAQHQAEVLGWLSERTETGDLVIHHPDGGRLTVSAAGTIDTTGFSGAGCQAAREQLGLERLGIGVSETTFKSEYTEAAAQIQLPG